MWDWKAVPGPGGGSWRICPSHSGSLRQFMTHPLTAPITHTSQGPTAGVVCGNLTGFAGVQSTSYGGKWALV